MLGINSNINSLVAQQNLTTSGSALSQAITRLSSGKRINSAADDAAGLAISNIMQTQVNGLNQGVSNANNGVSMVQTASSGLSSLTSSLQTIRQLAVQASDGSMTDSDRAALQQEVAQQIQEVNRIASQTTFNGMNILNGSLGSVSFQVGANVGQSMSVDLSQNLSAASLGGGVVQSGSTLGSFSNVSLNADGTTHTGSGSAAITSINVLSDGKGGFTYTDQNNQALSQTAISNLFGNSVGTGTALNITLSSNSALSVTNQLGGINSANSSNTPTTAGVTLGTISGINISGQTGQTVPAGTSNAITSITVKSDGSGGFEFFDQSGNALSSSLVGNSTQAGSLLTITQTGPGAAASLSFTTESQQLSQINSATNNSASTPEGNVLGTITGLSLDSSGNAAAAGSATITALTVKSDGAGGIELFDQTGAQIKGQAFKNLTGVDDSGTGKSGDVSSTATTPSLFTLTADSNGGANGVSITLNDPATQLTAINAAATTDTATGTKTYTIGNLSLNADGSADSNASTAAITAITVTEDGNGGFSFADQNGNALSSALTGITPGQSSGNNTVSGTLITVTKDANGTGIAGFSFTGTAPAAVAGLGNTPTLGTLSTIDANNTPSTVANIDISTATGANQAIESIDNALTTVDNIQATLGAAQNRFTAIATTQQAQSTDLSQAQSQIQDADFAQETANLSKAQVLQQAGISVLAQANSQPQQILKLLQ